MATTIRFKKVYVDTKFKSPDSKSTSDFSIELPETAHFNDNSVFYIDDVSIPHTWYSIEEDLNDKIYMRLTETSNNINITHSYIITLTAGNYTGAEMATMIQTKINAYTGAMTQIDYFTVSYSSPKNTIQITLLPGFTNMFFLSYLPMI